MAETAIAVEDRKELTYLLSQAAELEHGLMCEYLYAAFSLKRAADVLAAVSGALRRAAADLTAHVEAV